jgi:putative ABC transport system permease protein
MLKNYLVTAWRNLKRSPVFSFINITGLAIGLAVCMLILEYVEHENSYDKFHTNAVRICWVQTKVKLNSDSFFTSSIDYKLAFMAKQQSPVVESLVRLKKDDNDAIVQNTASPSLKFAESKFYFADSNFFSFFSFKLMGGDKGSVFKNAFSVVISKRIAEKYFATQNPIGKILRYNNTTNFVVSGVAENAPSNSSINCDFVAPLSGFIAMNNVKGELPDGKNSFTTYFLLKQPSDAARLEATLQRIDKEKQTDNGVFIRYIATPLTSTHLNANFFGDSANTKYLKVFPFVAALILLLALVNYMSLSTARSTTRAKEVGVRKVMGAARKTIAFQFFAESAMLTAIAFILGYLLCTLFQPMFFKFLEIDIDNSFLYNPNMLLSFAGLFILSVVLAATYPSILLSAYKPVMVLYGRLSKQAGGISVRKFFTVLQFTISIALIICGLVIEQQMYFFRHTDTGVNRNNIVMVPFTEKVGKHYPAFKKDVQLLTGIQQVSVARYPMYKGYDINVISNGPGTPFITVPSLSVDEHFIPMLGLRWKNPPKDSFYYKGKNMDVINEAAVEKFGLGPNPVNKSVDKAFIVAGVLMDFNYQSLQSKIGALVLSFNKDDDSAGMWANGGGCFFAKIKPQTNTASLLQQMKSIYARYDNDKPFEYYFMDDTFDAMYKAEDRLSKIFTLFTAFTLVIACLGLFGLSTFMAVQRTKEIGIRKVLGATVTNITVLLSKDFIKLVIIAVVLASPVAWWAMNNWLQGFAYRINIGWWVFAATASASVFIALATISYQAVRSALANPVKSLRSE